MLFKFVLLLFWIGMGDGIHENKHWIENYGIWYFMSPYELNFTSAIEYCLEEGANIAIVTAREQDLFLKQNGFYGWIGLTNTPSGMYDIPITQSTNTTVRPSFRDDWYWTVEDWILLSQKILTSKWDIYYFNDDVYPDMFYVNLDPQDVANADNNSAVVLDDDTYWRIVPSAGTYKAICEWQCELIHIQSNMRHDAGIVGFYLEQGFVNQRRFYKKEGVANKFLYYTENSKQLFWIINTNLTYSGYLVYLRNAFNSPLYNTTTWFGSNKTSQDIRLTCIGTTTTEFSKKYQITEFTCSGFYVYQDTTTTASSFLYLYRIQGTPYWCIGDAPCSDNMSVCNTHASPFPDKLTGRWVTPDKINYRSTTSEPFLSISSIGENEPDTETPETELVSITPEFEPTKVNHTFAIAIGVGCSVGGVCVIVAVVIAAARIHRRVGNTRQTRIKDSSESQQSTEYYNMCHSGNQRPRQLSDTTQLANVVQNVNHQYVNHNQLRSIEIETSGSTPGGSPGTTSPYTSLSAVPRTQHHQGQNNIVEYQQLQSLTYD